jgi:hypothetical protein
VGVGGGRVGWRPDRVPHQLAPALSADEQTLYVVVATQTTGVLYLSG